MKTLSKVIVVIPAFNEESNIAGVVENLKKHCSECDYIIVNDNSTDKTLQICKEKNLNYINLPNNLGIGGCVQTGYLYAFQHDYDIAIQLDGDGQHDPSYIGEMIRLIDSGETEIVIGSRFLDREGFQSTGLRRFGIAFLSMLIFFITGIKINDVTSGYRAVNRRFIGLFARHYVQDYPEPEAIMDAAFNKAKITEIPVLMHKRTGGKSSINTIKAFYYMIKVSVAIILHGLISSKTQEVKA